MALSGTFFNASYYISNNTDVAVNWVGTALNHYTLWGASENRAPNTWFNATEYRASYADLQSMDAVQLFDHYEDYGYREGRAPSSAYANFDEANYLETYSDLAAGGITKDTALNHFLVYGAKEGRIAKDDDGNTITGPATNQGTTFSLKIGQDDLTGAGGDDTFIAPVLNNGFGGLQNSLESVDTLDGGAGTDTLFATMNGGGAAPVLKNIEKVNVRFTAADAIDLTNTSGVVSATVNNSSTNGVVDGLGTIANIAVQNQVQDTSFSGSTATTLNIDLTSFGKSTAVNSVDLANTGKAAKASTINYNLNNAYATIAATTPTVTAKTVTVAATGTNTLTLTDDASVATSVTVTGKGSVNLNGAVFTGALTSFDASANEGGVKVDIQSTAAATVKGGKGNDVVDMDTAVVTKSAVDLGAGNDTLYTGALLDMFTLGVDGGEGTDIINITNGAKLTATTAKYISNFETLDVSGGIGNYDVSLNSFATVQIDEAINGALAGGVDFKNAPDNFSLTVASKAKDGDFAVGNTIAVTGKDYAGTTAAGTAETFTLVGNMNDGNADGKAGGNINTNTITAVGVEHLVVESNVVTLDGVATVKAAAHTLTAAFAAADAETITIKGAGSVALGGTSIGVVSKIDASASTGNVTVNFSTHALAMTYLGAEGVDTFTAGTKGATIYTGKGADVVTLDAAGGGAGAVRDIFVLKAATDSQITDTSKDGKITITADTGFDAITKFDGLGDSAVANSSDRLDLTNLSFSGSQRGVVDVSASVAGTTDLTSIADLFSSAAGDRGVAYSVIGGNSYVLVDANKDGNFTAADDIIIQLAGVATVSETMINF